MLAFLKKHIKASAAVAVVMFLAVGTAVGGPIALFTGPSGSNPVIFPADLPDLNTMVNNVNAALSTYIFFNNSGEPGEMNIISSTAFAANGSINTGLTAVGPVGSHTTVQKWLIVIDGAGNQLFAPLF